MSIQDIMSEQDAYYRLCYSDYLPSGSDIIKGNLLAMRDRTRWFHPYSGGAPIQITKAKEVYMTPIGEPRQNYENRMRETSNVLA